MKLSRRSWLGGAAALPFALRPDAAFGRQRPGSGGKPPNILFIMADDLGYADLSCYGRRDFQTPAIDRLAREGMRFTQAYANSPVCSATRTALLTGRYQYRLPIGLEEPLAGRAVGLPPDQPTLASMLRDCGYATALVGKWHLGAHPHYGPLKSGYEHFWGFRGGALDYFSHDTIAGKDLWSNDQPVSQQGYLTDLLADKSIEMLRTLAADVRPFFMSLHFNAPHWPWEGPDDEAESRRLAALEPGFDNMFSYDAGSQKTYAAMVTRMDWQIGRIREALRQLGILDNTIIIFTSDNGGERYADTWPFTGKKGELLEGGLRIPAIVRWPRHVAAGTLSEQTVMSMDWLPTLLAAAGASPTPGYRSDGISLLPALGGAPAIQRTLFWRYLNMNQEACRQGDWKYLKILDNTFLFNIAEDPLERANLKGRHPEMFARLVAAYRSWDREMLPLDPDAFTMGFTGKNMADHFGVDSIRLVRPPLHEP